MRKLKLLCLRHWVHFWKLTQKTTILRTRRYVLDFSMLSVYFWLPISLTYVRRQEKVYLTYISKSKTRSASNIFSLCYVDHTGSVVLWSEGVKNGVNFSWIACLLVFYLEEIVIACTWQVDFFVVFFLLGICEIKRPQQNFLFSHYLRKGRKCSLKKGK